ncbi:tRNA dimethylallyltransferase [Frankliniella fusca]|uniref:Gustatory receptor n=1 Tax=Frankliniella fusca TaxID=407009 RepID=A0AAE1LLA5_9NEOP|nr:tRNA dimethylallyltransferase [Frankliniella fusca]
MRARGCPRPESRPHAALLQASAAGGGMDLRWLTERCCCVTSTAATCLGLLPVRGWLAAPRPWPAPAAYGLGDHPPRPDRAAKLQHFSNIYAKASKNLDELGLHNHRNVFAPISFQAYVRDIDTKSELFPLLVACFFAFERATVTFSLCSNRAALTNLQRCLLHYQRVHPLPPRGYRAVLLLHLFVVIYVADVYLLFASALNGDKSWRAHEVAGLVTGIQWGMYFCMALLIKAQLGALAADLRDECARLMARAAGAGHRPASSTSRVKKSKVKEISVPILSANPPSVLTRAARGSLCQQWRSLRLRQQYLHDMSAATTRVYQWTLSIILLTSTLYANLQIADCLLKITGAKMDPIPPERQLLRKLAQISNSIIHCLSIVMLFVVYRWQGSESEQMCHMLQGHLALLSLHAEQEESGCVREVNLFIKQIRFQGPTDNVLGLLDINLSSMMRVIYPKHA